MTTHTLGKWEASGCTIYSGETILAVTYCEGNRELHPNIHEKDTPPNSDGKEHGDGWEEAWKNADLIAAAPEMLAALKELLADKYLADPINADRMAKTRAAIAKAEGNA
jgi:hypothetical protein